MAHFSTFKNYTWKESLTLIIATVSIVYAICSILYFTSIGDHPKNDFLNDGFVKIILISWSCGPPAWFFLEYYLMWPNASNEKKERLRVGRELAKPFWAAVLATLLLLIPK